VNIKGVIFDMDGTVVDVPYDWEKIRSELDTKGKPILAYIDNLEEPEKSEKWKQLEGFEYDATQRAVLKQGIRELLDFLKERDIKTALVTNNSRQNVSFILKRFDLNFDHVLSRDSGFWKPSGAPFVAVLTALNLKKQECCVIGDSFFDVKAGMAAGISQIFILNADRQKFSFTSVEVYSSLEEIRKRIVRLIEA
jgi:HAD superfamily hydrolase (TIGR01549 family)